MKYYISECLIIKDENEYLIEHIQKNMEAGIEHFFIYDNLSTVPVTTYLQDNAPELLNYCTIEIFDTVASLKNNAQLKCYNTLYLKDHAEESTWTVFIDTDEIFSGNLAELCTNLESTYSAIYFQELVHGGAGHITQDATSLVSRFSEHTIPSIKGFYKVIAKTSEIKVQTAHNTLLKEDGKSLKLDFSADVVLHHYHYKSFEEYVIKCLRGCVSGRSLSYTEYWRHNCWPPHSENQIKLILATYKLTD